MLGRRAVLTGLTTAPFASAGRRLFGDDFRQGDALWRVEAEKPSSIRIENGVLDIVAPAGLTAWFKPELVGPVEIRYQAQAVSEGGAWDRVSDLNCFWMARESDGGSPLDHPRSGAFADYDTLRTYYVGQGGNGNTTTRLRRYVGEAGKRPLLPQHDHAAADEMLRPNHWMTLRLVADGQRVEYWSEDRRLFELRDPQPYARGWFGLRTTQSHIRVRDFVILDAGR